MRSSAVILFTALVLSGCATQDAARASLSGSDRKTETVGGIVGGGLVSSSLGADLSRRARRVAVDAEYVALESTPAGRPVTWNEERSGASGQVTAAQPYRVGSQDCRSYDHAVNIRGSTFTARGAACRNEDGSWTLLN